MEFSGWWLLAAVVLVGGLLAPRIIMSRWHLSQNRDEDRFSQELRIIDPSEPQAHTHATRLPLIHPRQSGGEKMQTFSPAPTSLSSRRVAYENAVKARREAVAQRESAARKRLLAAIFTLVSFVAVAVAAGFSLVHPVLLVAPTVLFGGIMVLSRHARLSGQRYDESERKEILRLRRELRVVDPRARSKRSYDGSGVQGEEAPDSGRAGQTNSRVSDEVDKIFTAAIEKVEQRVCAADASTISEASTAGGEDSGNGSEKGKEWTPRGVPAPMYARVAKVSRREAVVAPEAEGWTEQAPKVSRRPMRAQPTAAGARTGDEVAADAIVKLDLQQVLDMRMASNE